KQMFNHSLSMENAVFVNNAQFGEGIFRGLCSCFPIYYDITIRHLATEVAVDWLVRLCRGARCSHRWCSKYSICVRCYKYCLECNTYLRCHYHHFADPG